MAYRYLTLAVDDRGVAELCLNRADKHNAFNEDFIAELSSVFDQLAGNPSVKAMVLRSDGKSFSAGADIDWMKRMAGNTREQNLADANALADMLYKLNFLPFPTIARVQGVAMGGGCGLVSCCDIAVATDDAAFAFSEARIGLVPATISPYVIAAIGEKHARRYFMTAERFTADTALRIGLVSEVVTAETLDSRIDAIIEAILANSADAVRAAKRLVFDVTGKAIDEELLHYSSEVIADIRASEEGKEGLAAFLEKRKPKWLKDT